MIEPPSPLCGVCGVSDLLDLRGGTLCDAFLVSRENLGVEDRRKSGVDLVAVLVGLAREPRQKLVTVCGRIGFDELERNRRAVVGIVGPVVFDEEVVFVPLHAVQAVPEKTVLLDGDADAATAGVDDVGAPEDDLLARDSPIQKWLLWLWI